LIFSNVLISNGIKQQKSAVRFFAVNP